jgi:hypothetical protein
MLYVGCDWANLQLARGGTYYAELGGTARVVSNAAEAGTKAAHATAYSTKYIFETG